MRGPTPWGLDRARFLLQLRRSLTFCLCLDLLCNLLGLGVSGLSSHSRVLLLGPREGLRWSPEASMQSALLPLTPPDLILEWLSIPWKKGAQSVQCGPAPHSLESWPPDSGTSLCPKCARGPGCGEPYYQRAPQPHSRRPSLLVLGSPCISHHYRRDMYCNAQAYCRTAHSWVPNSLWLSWLTLWLKASITWGAGGQM